MELARLSSGVPAQSIAFKIETIIGIAVLCLRGVQHRRSPSSSSLLSRESCLGLPFSISRFDGARVVLLYHMPPKVRGGRRRGVVRAHPREGRAAARPRGPSIPTPRSQARGPAWPVLRRAKVPRAVVQVCAIAPPCSSLSAAPGVVALLATMETNCVLPQIGPHAATMCFGTGSTGTLWVSSPARRVCNSYAAFLGRELADRSCEPVTRPPRALLCL